MKTIQVGLTGLSRAGKTVFLTSAIHELIETTGEGLREFKNSGWSYAGYVEPIRDGAEPFLYGDRLERLRENPPRWPEPTENISEYHLHLKLLRADGKRREGRIVFVDYPGEMLTDVALLDTRYQEWSDECFRSLASPFGTTEDAAREFLESVRTLTADAKGRVPEHQRHAAQYAFGSYGVAAWQAGRPVAPLEPVLKSISPPSPPLAPFFPLDAEMRKRMPHLLEQMEIAYSKYGTVTVSPFLDRIAACSRQIVLVDLFDILRSGPSKHNEAKELMKKVLRCFAKANRTVLSRIVSRIPILRNRRIRKTMFCATKADQVTEDHRLNLEMLLRDMHSAAAKEIEFNDPTIKPIFKAISAYRCTDDVASNHEGKPVMALKGRLRERSSEAIGPYCPGKVPSAWPEFKSEWSSFGSPEWFPEFLPRPLPAINGGRPFNSIKMDQILFWIVEDLLK